MADEWFRSSAWDDAAQAEFDRRLLRSRPANRAQYLRIKGLALRDAANPAGAKHLFQRVLDEYPASLDYAAALEHLADLERAAGNIEIAERLYCDLLTRHPTLNATTGMADVSLAELLLDAGGRGQAEEALQLLNAAMARAGAMTLNANLFRWHVALVRAADAIGDADTSRRAARTALDLVELGPQFARHPTVGIIQADEATLAWLRQRSAVVPR